MSRGVRVLAALIFALLVGGGVRVAHAAECVDDWPKYPECFPDILCPEYSEYWDLRRSVVHISGPDIGGTGVLLNNAKCDFDEDDCGAPYLLTANHVASGHPKHEMTDGQRNTLEKETMFTFGLEAAVCGGETSVGAVAVKGAAIIADSVPKDLLLLRLDTTLPP